MQDRFRYEYDTIIVGSTLPALLYAHFWRIPFISGKLEPPDKFDCFPVDVDLSDFKLESGCERYKLWDRLFFELAMTGYNLMGDKGSSVRIEKNIVKVPTKNARMGRFMYRKLLIFSETNVTGLPDFTHFLQNPMHRVIDYFNVLVDKSEIEFLGKLRHPYESGRAFIEYLIIGKPTVGISYLSQDDLADHDYSEVTAKFKVLKMIRDAGFKGKRNGRDPKRKDGWVRYAVKVNHLERETIQICRNTTYQDTARIQFKHDSDVGLLKIFSQ